VRDLKLGEAVCSRQQNIAESRTFLDLRIACLEVIGFPTDLLDLAGFEKSITRLGKSSCGNYPRTVLEKALSS
jgi:hypothetical protein